MPGPDSPLFLQPSPGEIDARDPLGIGGGRGGRKRHQPPTVEVLRELGPEDLPRLQGRDAAPAPLQTISRIRHSHHQLAQLLAKGTHSEQECALITGYNPTYISNIKNNDPAFRELLAHYQGIQEQVFVDVLDRLKVLGLSSIDELQARLEEAPDEWSRRELMELAELTLLKPITAVRGALPADGRSAGPVQVSVNFVTADHQPRMVDITPQQEPKP